LLSIVIAMVLVYGTALVGVRDPGLRWLARAIFDPGLKGASLLLPGGPRGANPSVYFKLSIFLSLILWWVVVELIWIAVVKLKERNRGY
jgi:hypothetical protein